MADSYGHSSREGELDQFFDLLFDIFFVQRMVDKETPFHRFHSKTLGHLKANRLRRGPAIQKEEISSFQLRKNDPHLFSVLHQSGSHMVAGPLNIRDCL